MTTIDELHAIIDELELIDAGDAACYLGEEEYDQAHVADAPLADESVCAFYHPSDALAS